jgi:YD repeat-containing protein
VLLSVSTHDGRVTTLTYSDANTPSNVAPAAGLLVTVTEHAADTSTYVDLVLRFSYDAKYRITQMTDPTGAITRYGYDANNNLVSVTWPDGYVRRYLYEDARFWSAMTGVIDETGSRVATWTYDAKGRAVAASHPDTTRNVQFGYGANSTTVTDSRRTTTLNFFSIAGVQRPTGSSSSLGNTATTWDATGNLLTDSAADGSSTEYSYDDIGRPTRVARRTSMGLSVTSVRYADATTLHPSLVAMPRMMRGFAYDERGNLVGLSELSTDDVTGASGFDAKSTAEQRTYGFAYDSRNRLTDTLTMVNGQTVEHLHQTYDRSADRRIAMSLTGGRNYGIVMRDMAHRPIELMDDGMLAYAVYDVRGRVKQFTYVEAAAPSNGKVSRTLTVDYIYSPHGRVVSRMGTVKPESGSAVAIGQDEIDEWLDNYELGINPAGSAIGLLKNSNVLLFVPEPGLEPVCVECLIAPIRWARAGIDLFRPGWKNTEKGCTQAQPASQSLEELGYSPNSIPHIFKDKHMLTPLVERVGSKETALIRMDEVAQKSIPEASYQTGRWVTIEVDGIYVSVKGRFLNGRFRISTATMKDF